MSIGDFRSPTSIKLRGSGVALRYAVDRAGRRLTYEGPEGAFTFSDSQIRDLETPIGRLLTVQLSSRPDAETLELALLLPTINLPRVGGATSRQAGDTAGSTTMDFSTLAILTTIRTSIAGPGLVPGVLESYHVLELQGRADDLADQTAQPESHPAVAAILAALEAAAARLTIPLASLEVERLERRDWPDTCLGCPEPGEVCGDAITPGYAVFVAREGQEQLLAYRADRAGCVRLCPAPDPSLPLALFRHWVHLREADSGDVEEYRPEGFPFPPAFGRDGFRIYQDGIFIQEDVGPLDVPLAVLGRWELSEPNRLAVAFDAGRLNRPAREGYALDIVSVDEAALRVRRSSAPPPVPASDEAEAQAFAGLPAAESCRLVDFERAEIITLRRSPPQFVLRVSGTLPYRNMQVALVPRVYVRQPEYWGIEVVGCLPGIGLPALTPYSVSISLSGVTGTAGVEVIGATRTQQLAVPPDAVPPGECRDWSAWIDTEPLGRPTLHVTGQCVFPTPGFSVELRRHEPQGINPRDLLLDKIVTPPTDPQPTVLTTVDIHYREAASLGRFETVTILPDGPTIPVRKVA